MKRINIITTAIVFVVMIVAVFLVAQIARTKPFRKAGLSAELVLEAATLKKEDIEQKRNHILTLHKKGDSQATIKAAEEYLKLVPRDDEIWIILSEHYLGTGKLNKAERAVTKALRANPQSSWGFRTLARIYRIKATQSPRDRQKFLSKAQLKIEEALRLSSNDPWDNMEAANVYLAQGKRKEALQEINKALELIPEERGFLEFKKQILSEGER